jgi:hypothetical protein
MAAEKDHSLLVKCENYSVYGEFAGCISWSQLKKLSEQEFFSGQSKIFWQN